MEETRVDVTLDGADVPDAIKPKDRPVWMTESTVVSNDPSASESADSILQKAALTSTQSTVTVGATGSGSASSRHRRDNEDIMQVLLQHEKQQGKNTVAQTAVKGLGAAANSSDSSDDEQEIENAVIRKYIFR